MRNNIHMNHAYLTSFLIYDLRPAEEPPEKFELTLEKPFHPLPPTVYEYFIFVHVIAVIANILRWTRNQTYCTVTIIVLLFY